MSYQIKVVFTRETNPDFLSTQIMNKDKTDYSHVLVLFHDDNNIEKIFHAVGEGVCVEDSEPYFKTHIKAHVFEIDLDVTKDYFLGFVRGSNGKEYSQSQIASMAVGKTEKNGDEKMICSELVGIILHEMSQYKMHGHQDSWRPVHCFDVLKG